jgi:hypothetical protein
MASLLCSKQPRAPLQVAAKQMLMQGIEVERPMIAQPILPVWLPQFIIYIWDGF